MATHLLTMTMCSVQHMFRLTHTPFSALDCVQIEIPTARIGVCIYMIISLYTLPCVIFLYGLLFMPDRNKNDYVYTYKYFRKLSLLLLYPTAVLCRFVCMCTYIEVPWLWLHIMILM